MRASHTVVGRRPEDLHLVILALYAGQAQVVGLSRINGIRGLFGPPHRLDLFEAVERGSVPKTYVNLLIVAIATMSLPETEGVNANQTLGSLGALGRGRY